MASIYLSPSIQKSNKFCVGGISEAQNSNAVADVLEAALKNKYGLTVYRNSQSMETISQIITDSNAKKPDIHVAIHSNAGGGHGCEVYRGYTDNSKWLAQYIYEEMAAVTPSSDRGVKDGMSLGEINSTNAYACLIEMAFHDNAEDAAWMIANRQACSTAIEKGIVKYFGIAYKPDTQPTPTSASVGNITVGSTVKIKVGAVYGGLASARGTAVPSSKIGIAYKVSKIQVNKDTQEALLEGINSWVAVASLELVSSVSTPEQAVDYKALYEQAQAKIAELQGNLSSLNSVLSSMTDKYNKLIEGLKALL